jgi:UDP-glucuronate 4-epimerase
MKILVTGGAGFIGKHLCKALKTAKHDVIILDLKLSNQHDIRNKFDLSNFFLLNHFDMVIHLAALAGTVRSKDFPEEYISTNILGTQNIIEMCQKYNVKLIHFSSSSVLGGCSVANNNKIRAMSECDPYNPKNIYGVTKVAGELLVKNSGLHYTIVRPFTVFGRQGRHDMVIYKWVDQVNAGKPITVYGDTTSSRGYTYVEDLVEAVIKIIERMKTEKISRTIHLGGSEVIKLMKLIKLFDDYCKKRGIEFSINNLPEMPGDVRHSFADTSLAKKLIGFDPKPRFLRLIKDILITEFYTPPNTRKK